MKFASALALFATAALPSVFAATFIVNVGLDGNNTFTVCITAFPICFALITPAIALEYDGEGRRPHRVLIFFRRKPRMCLLLDILMVPT